MKSVDLRWRIMTFNSLCLVLSSWTLFAVSASVELISILISKVYGALREPPFLSHVVFFYETKQAATTTKIFGISISKRPLTRFVGGKSDAIIRHLVHTLAYSSVTFRKQRKYGFKFNCNSNNRISPTTNHIPQYILYTHVSNERHRFKWSFMNGINVKWHRFPLWMRV